MAGFLYFTPDTTKNVTLDDVRAWGLGYAFSRTPSSSLCLNHTPTGGTGMIFADDRRLGDCAMQMNLDEQQWRKVPKSDCYVGYWKAAPPTPGDLIRTPYLPGYQVSMGDHDWIIPLTARFDESRQMLVTTLPCYLECDDDGNWTEGDVLALHRHLWEIGQPFRDDVAERISQNTPPRDFTNNELSSAAVGYLQANYVVGPGELSLMRGLQKGPEIQGAIMAANDFWTFAKWSEQQKKTDDHPAAAGLSTVNGDAD